MDSDSTPTQLRPNRLRHALSAVFQIHSSKPLSVKILQWLFLLIPLFYFITLHGGAFPFWWYDWSFIASFFMIFMCLYRYKILGLYLLRIIGFFPIFFILPIFSFMIINFGLTLIGIPLQDINALQLINEIEKLNNREAFINAMFFGSWFVIYVMIPFFIIYAFLWNQVDRYKYFELKKLLNSPKSSAPTKMPL